MENALSFSNPVSGTVNDTFIHMEVNMMDKYQEIKEKIEQRVKDNIQDAIKINDYMADNPEVATEEFKSSQAIVDLLKDKGFDVEYPFANVATAFKAVYGANNHKYKIALLAEYDALPGIGHACGHCVSASISVLAGIAMRDLEDELNADIHIIGTPEEEVDGAKCRMVDQGVFDNYDMAMMIHLYDQNLLYCTLLALNSYLYTFHGKAAHASAAPWDGVNALNGAQLMIHGVDMLRQHVTPDVRMHSVYRNGGAAPNIVPETASLEIYVRALQRQYLDTVIEKVEDCARGAAIATQTTYDREDTSHPYDNLVNNATGLDSLKEIFGELDLELGAGHDDIFGSSDIGNVSFKCPTFHPTLQLVEKGIPIHTRDFEAAVKTDKAHEVIATGATVIALQCAKIFSDEEKIKKLKEDFAQK